MKKYVVLGINWEHSKKYNHSNVPWMILLETNILTVARVYAVARSFFGDWNDAASPWVCTAAKLMNT